MKEHYEPKPQKYVQRTKFENRNRHPTETVSQYVAALRHLSEFCDFGNSLEERICERIVRGINDGNIQRRLLSEVDLTLQKAIQIAQAVVTSETGAKDLHAHDKHNSYNPSGLHHLHRKSNSNWHDRKPNPVNMS